MVHAFLIDANMPAYFWVDAAHAAVSLSIGFPFLFYITRHPMKLYLKERLTTHFLNPLDASVFQISWPLTTKKVEALHI